MLNFSIFNGCGRLIMQGVSIMAETYMDRYERFKKLI